MNRYFKIIALLLVVFTVRVKAQLTPQDAVKGIAKGINLGNEMEAPNEGKWNLPIQEHAFDDFKNAGFISVLIPITWNGHTALIPPCIMENTWLNRVEKVVNWGLQRGLFIIFNAHHETWIKTWYSDSIVARFDSIWSKTTTHFKCKSDSLIFEIINEPYPMSEQHVNELNVNVLKIIRQIIPTRIISLSGYGWLNSDQLVIAAIPDSSNKYLIGYYHSYDPYPFDLKCPRIYGSTSDIIATKARFDEVTAWSKKNNIPIIYEN